MRVGVKRLFPIAAIEPVTFSENTGFDWKIVEPAAKFASILGAPFSQQNSSTYRQFRFRVTYYDSLASVGDTSIQLSISHDGSFPAGTLSTDNLVLPAARCPRGSTSATAYTPWFTVGNGAVDKLQPYLNTNASLSVRYTASAGSALSAIVYNVDLECWDFTSPIAFDTAIVPDTTSLVSTTMRLWYSH